MFEPPTHVDGHPGVYAIGAAVRVQALLDRLMAAAPGPYLVEEPAALRLDELTPLSRARALQLWERVSAWVAAQEQALVVAITGERSRGDDWSREEVACLLRISPTSAQGRIAVARRLCGALRDTKAAMAAGRVTLWQAQYLANAVSDLDDATATKVQDRVLPRADKQTMPNFQASVRRAVAAIDPRGLSERHKTALHGHTVELVPGANAMATLYATMSAPDASSSTSPATRPRALRMPDDERTLPERRADALVQLLWRRIITDPASGAVIDVGQTYVPSQRLKDRVLRRYERCVFPGCCMPSVRRDLDHNTRFPDGPTCGCNLVHRQSAPCAPAEQRCLAWPDRATQACPQAVNPSATAVAELR